MSDFLLAVISPKQKAVGVGNDERGISESGSLESSLYPQGGGRALCRPPNGRKQAFWMRRAFSSCLPFSSFIPNQEGLNLGIFP